MEDKCQGHADHGGEDDADNRDKQAVAQRFSSGRRREEADIRLERNVALRQEAVQERKDVWIQDADDEDEKNQNGNHGDGMMWYWPEGIVISTLSPEPNGFSP